MTLSIKRTGSLAHMGIADEVASQAAADAAMLAQLQESFARLYAGRYASCAFGYKGGRYDCMNHTTVIYASPRIYARAQYASQH